MEKIKKKKEKSGCDDHMVCDKATADGRQSDSCRINVRIHQKQSFLLKIIFKRKKIKKERKKEKKVDAMIKWYATKRQPTKQQLSNYTYQITDISFFKF